MSYCSSCTRPPCLAIVADMLKTYKTLVAASESENRRLPLPYTLPLPPPECLKLFWSIPGDAYHQIRQRKCQSCRHRVVQYPALCGQKPSSTMGVSRYRQRDIGHIALSVCRLFIIRSIYGCIPGYRHTHIQLCAASCLCCFRFYRRFSNVRPASCFGWLHWQLRGGLPGVCVVAVYFQVTR